MKTGIAGWCALAALAAFLLPLSGSPANPIINYDSLPICFEANTGQAPPAVKFLAHGRNATLSLAPGEALLALAPASKTTAAAVLRLTLAGANPNERLEGLQPLAARANYFVGSDPRQWHADVPMFARVKYCNVYPGVDVIYYGSQQTLEYDFVVRPGANPNNILLQFSGADKMTLTPAGDLSLEVNGRAICEHKPVVYQEIGGQRKMFTANYVLHSSMQAGLEIAGYDKSLSLVIDPTLSYAATFGGSGANNALAVAVDSNDDVYITGNTTANNFPTSNAYQAAFAGDEDAFVMKLDAGGNLVYSTYLGGGVLNNINQGSSGQGIAVDNNGDAFVAGWTQVTNFPVKNALQPTNGGNCDAFMTKLNPAGNALVFSTYLGGKGLDAANAIALDTNAEVLVTGYTESTNFPTASAAQPAYGGNGDAFVAKLSSDGSTLIYSTYLGGSNSENNAGSQLQGYPSLILPLHGGAIASDFDGNVYVSGWTFSTNFPVMNAFQPTNTSGFPNYYPSAFITEIDPVGNMVQSTYFGGATLNYGSVYGRAIGVDANSGNIYLAGSTTSPNLPLKNPISSYVGQGAAGQGDGFVAAFDSTGTNLVYCTYLGGSGDDQINGLSVRSADGAVAVTGFTSSPDFPLLQAIQTNGNQGCFKSSNGGSVWANSPSLPGSATVDAVLVDRFNPATVYVITSSGFFKSTDGGNTWNAASSGLGSISLPLAGAGNNDFAADPVHSGVLYLACFDGIYKTTNGAANWFASGSGMPANPGIQVVAIDPENPLKLYAGTYSYGIYKSVDGGNTWSVTTNGLNNFFVTALAVDPLNSSNILAGVQNYNNTCLFRSTNGGMSWVAVNGMPGDPYNEHTIIQFCVNTGSIYAIVGDVIEDANLDVSTNGGATWTSDFYAQGLKFTTLAVAAPSVSAPALSISRSATNDVLSWAPSFTNYVLQFSPSLNPPDWQPMAAPGTTTVTNPMAGSEGFYRLAGTNGSASLPTLYLGTDAASGQGVLKSLDGGVTWNSVGFAGDTISAVAASSANPAQVYAGLNGKNTAFIATLDPVGQLYFSTFLGGTGNDAGNAISLWDGTTSIEAGSTTSADFPTNSNVPHIQIIQHSVRDVASGGVQSAVSQRAGGVESADEQTSTGPVGGGEGTIAKTTETMSCGGSETEKKIIVKANQRINGFIRFYEDDWGFFTHSISGLPPGMDYDLIDSPGRPNNFGFSGTPTTAGTYTVTFTCTDGSGCNWNYTFTIIVQ